MPGVEDRRPFRGIKVLDVTRVLASPFATYQLALHGAEVINVEEPAGGDSARRAGGPEGKALIANGMWGLAGFSVALVVLHLAAVQFGTWPAYGLSLATSMVWNFSVWSVRRWQALRASRA